MDYLLEAALILGFGPATLYSAISGVRANLLAPSLHCIRAAFRIIEGGGNQSTRKH